MSALANDSFVGVLDNDSYSFTHLPPGRTRIIWALPPGEEYPQHLIEGFDIELAGGQVYYLDVRFRRRQATGEFYPPRLVEAAEGERLLADVKWLSRPTSEQKQDGTVWGGLLPRLREVSWSFKAGEQAEDLEKRARKHPELKPQDLIEEAGKARAEHFTGTLTTVFLDASACALAGRRALEQGARSEAVRFLREAEAGFGEAGRRARLRIEYQKNRSALGDPEARVVKLAHRSVGGGAVPLVPKAFAKWRARSLAEHCEVEQRLATAALGCARSAGDDEALVRCASSAAEDAAAPPGVAE